MKLHYQINGHGRPVLIIHGLFGSLDNWRMIVKQLSEHAQVITVDLRNHGRSPHSTEQNYKLMAEDIAELLQELRISNIDLIGHSVGGKVAMAFSHYYPDYCNKLVVVDIAPKQYQQEHDVIFKALLSLDLSLYSKRNEVDAVLAKTITDKAIRQFLLMNLDITGDMVTWRINLQGLFDNYPQLLQAVCENQIITIPACFIRGGRSNYILNEDIEQISSLYSNSEVHTIEKAGHWVHAEQPQAFLIKVNEFLDYDKA